MGIPFVELNFRRPIYPAIDLLAKLFRNIESKKTGLIRAVSLPTKLFPKLSAWLTFADALEMERNSRPASLGN
jgi:hypothetical protein